MVELNDIKIGEKYWYMVLEISYSKSRINKKIPPVEVEAKEIDRRRWYGEKLKVTWKDKSGEKDLWINPSYLYQTKEEAIEYWNSKIYNSIDWVNSERDKKVANLKKNLLPDDKI